MITRRDALLGTSAMIAAAVAPRIPHAQDAALIRFRVEPPVLGDIAWRIPSGYEALTIDNRFGGGPLVAGDIIRGRTALVVFDGRGWRAWEPGPAEHGPHGGPPAGFPGPARPA